MDRITNKVLLVAAMALLPGCSLYDVKLDASTAPKMGGLEALETLTREIGQTVPGGVGGGCDNRDRRISFEVSRQGLNVICEVAGPSQRLFRDFAAAGYWCDPVNKDTCNVGLIDERSDLHVRFDPASRAGAIAFVEAWHSLAHLPATGFLVEPSFEQVVQRYLAQSPRPEIGEDVRRFKIEAETAVRQKDLLGAMRAYGEALKVAPWWPQGRFNRALIMGELGFPPEAAQDMKRYLQLVPDAANARQAQDKIFQWEALSKR